VDQIQMGLAWPPLLWSNGVDSASLKTVIQEIWRSRNWYLYRSYRLWTKFLKQS